MSRARDMANLGAQAGSGFDASDLTTGTLGNTVQDNITRLGTVTTGTIKNTIHSDATFPNNHLINYNRTLNEFGDIQITGNGTVVDADGNGYTVNVTAGNMITANIYGGFLRFGEGQGGYVSIGMRLKWSNSSTEDFVSSRYFMWDQTTDWQAMTPFAQGSTGVPSGVTSVEVLRLMYADIDAVDIYWTTSHANAMAQCHVWEYQQ